MSTTHIFPSLLHNTFVLMAQQYAAKVCGLHAKQGSDIPCFYHNQDVARILAFYQASPILVAAGYLHDIPKHQKEPLDATLIFQGKLQKEGAQALQLVYSVLEEKPSNADSWKKQKELYLAALIRGTYEEKLLVGADKLSDMQFTLDQISLQGPFFFQLNAMSSKDYLWFCENIYTAIRKDMSDEFIQQYSVLLLELGRKV